MLLIRETIFPKVIGCCCLFYCFVFVQILPVQNIFSHQFISAKASQSDSRKELPICLFPYMIQEGTLWPITAKAHSDLKILPTWRTWWYTIPKQKIHCLRKDRQQVLPHPTSYTFDEYWAIKNRQAEMEYFKKRANTTSILNRGKINPNCPFTITSLTGCLATENKYSTTGKRGYYGRLPWAAH